MPSVLLLDSCGIASVSALPEFEWFIIIPPPGWKQNLLGQHLPRWALLSCCCEMLFCWSLSGTGSTAATAGSPGCSLNSSGLDRYYPCVLCLGKIGKHCWIRAYKKDSSPCQKSYVSHLCLSNLLQFLAFPEASATSIGLAASLELPASMHLLLGTPHQTAQSSALQSGAAILSRPEAFWNTDLELGNGNNSYCMFFKAIYLCYE